MNVGATDIDRIVREVLEQLRQPNVKNGKPSAHDASDSKTAWIDARVVTLATLEGRLNGVSRVALTTGAVVTPAVKDELRRLGIAIIQNGSKEKSKNIGQRACLGAAATETFDAKTLWKALPSIEVILEGEVKQATSDLCEAIIGRNLPGLLLTERPAEALCRANRSHRIRAALGLSVEMTQEALDTLDANLLVVDPRARGLYELRKIAERFLSS